MVESTHDFIGFFTIAIFTKNINLLRFLPAIHSRVSQRQGNAGINVSDDHNMHPMKGFYEASACECLFAIRTALILQGFIHKN